MAYDKYNDHTVHIYNKSILNSNFYVTVKYSIPWGSRHVHVLYVYIIFLNFFRADDLATTQSYTTSSAGSTTF